MGVWSRAPAGHKGLSSSEQRAPAGLQLLLLPVPCALRCCGCRAHAVRVPHAPSQPRPNTAPDRDLGYADGAEMRAALPALTTTLCNKLWDEWEQRGGFDAEDE